MEHYQQPGSQLEEQALQVLVKHAVDRVEAGERCVIACTRSRDTKDVVYTLRNVATRLPESASPSTLSTAFAAWRAQHTEGDLLVVLKDLKTPEDFYEVKRSAQAQGFDHVLYMV